MDQAFLPYPVSEDRLAMKRRYRNCRLCDAMEFSEPVIMSVILPTSILPTVYPSTSTLSPSVLLPTSRTRVPNR